MALNCPDLLIGNSMSVTLTDVRIGDEYQNEAECTVTVKDSEGEIVPGANEIEMPYVAESDGEYEGILPHSLPLTENARYTVIVDATVDGATVGNWVVEKVAKYRR